LNAHARFVGGGVKALCERPYNNARNNGENGDDRGLWGVILKIERGGMAEGVFLKEMSWPFFKI
jgi:hypothetical protein